MWPLRTGKRAPPTGRKRGRANFFVERDTEKSDLEAAVQNPKRGPRGGCKESETGYHHIPLGVTVWPIRPFAALAQSVEQLTLNQRVRGSSPRGRIPPLVGGISEPAEIAAVTCP